MAPPDSAAMLLQSGDPHAITTAASLLRGGGVVVFPTDTVYGVGVVVTDEAAIERLYLVKGRPSEKGIPVLLSDPDDIVRICRFIPAAARSLMERFWPGPLTLVLPRRLELPAKLSPDANVAVRVPNHSIARALIRAAGGALATTSANLSGREPARSGLAAFADLGDRVDAVLDDGPSPGDVASTIVDCTCDPFVILRAGPLSATDLGLEEETRARV